MFGRERTNKMKTLGISLPDRRDPAAENEHGAEHREVSRRTLLKGGGAALAGLTVLQVAGPAHAFPASAGEEARA